MKDNDLNDFNAADLFADDDAPAEMPTERTETNEFEQMIVEGTRQDSRLIDANKPRYGIALLKPIALFDASPAFYMGDFNIKHADRSRGNKVNVPFFPRLKLMPFTSKNYEIPYEGKADALTDDEYEQEMRDQSLESFDVATIESTLQGARRKRFISAEKWSLQMYDRYKKEGFILLHDLTGIESYGEACRLLEAVLTPEKILARIPQQRRERLGFELDPPFMPEIIAYLSSFARDAYAKELRQNGDVQTMEKIRQALLLGARQAQKYCEKTLSDTEAEIKRGDKRGYDLPDFVHQNAKPPKDLVAMIHLNRYPKDMEALRIAETTGAAVAAAANGNARTIEQPAADSIPRAEVERLLDERDQVWEERFDTTLANLREEFSAAANADEAAPEAPAKTETTVAKKPNEKK